MIKRKNLSIILAVFMTVFFIFGCGGSGRDSDDPTDDPAHDGSGRRFATVHQFTSRETNIDLVLNGQTEYRIVFNPNDNALTRENAVGELQLFFQQATGIWLEAIPHTGLTFSESDKFISIGNTGLLSQAGLTPDFNQLGTGGYVIRNRGNSVFLSGGFYGNLYAVYEFLRQQFNFRVFAEDEIRINRNVTNLKLLEFDVIDIPDFQYRVRNWGDTFFNTTHSRRMRMNTFEDVWLRLGGRNIQHNFFDTVEVEVPDWRTRYPEWIAVGARQLCFSRNTDRLVQVVFEEMQRTIRTQTNVHHLTFTAEDYNEWCNCAACVASREYYGTDAAVYIKFVNRVARLVQEWLPREFPNREVTIVIFAYHRVVNAPVRQEADGSFVPISPEVVLESNVALLYAPIFAFFYYDFDHEMNWDTALHLDKWASISQTIQAWTYCTYFSHYWLPFDSFNSMQNIYRFLWERNANYIFDQGQFNIRVSTDWGRLKSFLNAHLQWDFQLDKNELIDEWFENYFRSAAEPMHRMFQTYRTYFAYLAHVHGVHGHLPSRDVIFSTRAWPLETLIMFLGYIDEAYESIEYLRHVNPELHQRLHDRINIESVAYRWLLMELHPGAFSFERLNEFTIELRDDTMRLGINMFNEQQTTSEFWAGV